MGERKWKHEFRAKTHPRYRSTRVSKRPSDNQDQDAVILRGKRPSRHGSVKSSRRRRRKRKGKGSKGNRSTWLHSPVTSSHPGNLCRINPANLDNPSPPCRPPLPRRRISPTPASSRTILAPANAGRKKFRDRDRQRSPENPGNVASLAGSGSNNSGGYRDRDTHQFGNNAGSGGFKRKGGGGKQQRGPRS